jgi:hypothetical protein
MSREVHVQVLREAGGAIPSAYSTLSSSAVEESVGEILRQLQSRRKQQGYESHPTENPLLAVSLSNRQVGRRSGENVQSRHPGLDELLRSLL